MKRITWSQFMTFRSTAHSDMTEHLKKEYGHKYDHLFTSDVEALVKMSISQFVETLHLHNYLEIDHSK